MIEKLFKMSGYTVIPTDEIVEKINEIIDEINELKNKPIKISEGISERIRPLQDFPHKETDPFNEDA